MTELTYSPPGRFGSSQAVKALPVIFAQVAFWSEVRIAMTAFVASAFLAIMSFQFP